MKRDIFSCSRGLSAEEGGAAEAVGVDVGANN